MRQGLVVYGVRDMVEWNAIIRLGAGSLNVPFCHGSFSGLGSNSAEYRTDDPAIQFAIEQSEYFKSGRITILSDKRVEVKVPKANAQEGEAEKSSVIQAEVGSQSAEAKAKAETPETESKEGEGENESEAPEGLTEIEVATREDAKQYLVDKFGIKASALRSKDAIHEQARGQGIRFVGASDL